MSEQLPVIGGEPGKYFQAAGNVLLAGVILIGFGTLIYLFLRVLAEREGY